MRLPAFLWRLLWPFRARRQAGLQVGERFPDFELKDVAGRPWALSDTYEGRWTVLWFTNLCDDCRARIPLLEELRELAGDQFRIAAVSLLEARDSLPRELAKDCGFPILIDPEDIVQKRLGLPHPPGTCPIQNLFILDKSGTILFRHHLSALKPEAFRRVWRGLATDPAQSPRAPAGGA